MALGALIFIHERALPGGEGDGGGRGAVLARIRPRIWSIRRGETEYCLSIVPLGGYVKMTGRKHAEDAIHPSTEAPAIDLQKSFSSKPSGPAR